MKKVLLYQLTLFFYVFSASAQNKSQDSLKLSLEECIELVFKNNHNRQSIVLNELSAQESYNQSKLELLPNLSATIGESYSQSKGSGIDWSGNYGLNTGVAVYQGGYVRSTIENVRLSSEQSKYRTTQYDNELTIQVLQSFLTALGNEELLRYQNAVLKASNEQLNQGKIRYEAGDILQSDFLMLEAQYANDLSNVLETKISRNNSLNSLKNLMSIDLSQEIKIIYPDESMLNTMGIMPSEDEFIARSMETLPELRIIDYDVKIAKTGVQISRSSFFPTISLSAGIATGHTSNFNRYGTQLNNRLNENVGITLNIPIFNNGRTKTKVTQSKISLQQYELERKQTELDVMQTLNQEFQNVVLAESKFKSSQIQQNAYLASYEAYKLKFEQGSITAVELLQQQNNYIHVLNDYIQSKYGFLLKRKVLDVYMGYPVQL
ncbi:MAG: TolC family protein [Bacteroidales bacterium]|jgi:outer membrane protein|nr:TolC family protein [Bacteroidales bacterium]MDD3700359.1 TolC family protein [Bacteroidales bacterium]MDY0368755.1 TolC family protein [Bacteroidales bacterium]